MAMFFVYLCHPTRPLWTRDGKTGEEGHTGTGEAFYSSIREGDAHFFPPDGKHLNTVDVTQPWLLEIEN